MDIIENCICRLNGGFAIRHNPKASGLDWCPNPQCAHGVKGNNFQPYEGELHMDKMQTGMWFQRTEILDAHLAVYPHNSNSNGTA